MESLGILLAKVAAKKDLTKQEILEIQVQADRVNQAAPIADMIDPITETIDSLRVGNIRINRYGILAGHGRPGIDFTGLRIADPSTVSIAGYSTEVLQWGVTTDGKLTAGAGAVTLDSSGITANAGVIGGWNITTTSLESTTPSGDDFGIYLRSTVPEIRVGSETGQHILISGSSNAAHIRGSNYSSGMAGLNIDAQTGDAEFNSIVARGEIRTAVFAFNQIQAYSGALGVFKGAGVLSTSIVVPATTGTTATLVVDNPTGSTANIFSQNDIIRLKGWTVPLVLQTRGSRSLRPRRRPTTITK